MSDIPLDRQVLIVSWYSLRDLDDIVSKSSRAATSRVQSWLKRPPRRGERPLDNLIGITEPCVVSSNRKAPDNSTTRSITLES